MHPTVHPTVHPDLSPDTLTVEEAQSYLQEAQRAQPFLAAGVSLVVGSPIPQLLGMAMVKGGATSMQIATIIGGAITTVMVIIGVVLMIFVGQRLYRFEELGKTDRRTTPEITQVVEEWRRAYLQQKTMTLGVALALFALSPIPLLVSNRTLSASTQQWAEPLFIVLLLLIVAIAAGLVVWSVSTFQAERVLLQEKEYDPELREKRRAMRITRAVYWIVVVLAAAVLYATRVVDGPDYLGAYVLGAVGIYFILRTGFRAHMRRSKGLPNP